MGQFSTVELNLTKRVDKFHPTSPDGPTIVAAAGAKSEASGGAAALMNA